MSTFHETAIAAAIAGKLPFGYPVIPAPSTDPGAVSYTHLTLPTKA